MTFHISGYCVTIFRQSSYRFHTHNPKLKLSFEINILPSSYCHRNIQFHTFGIQSHQSSRHRIPTTMCVLTVMTNENNKPVRAKQEPHLCPWQLGGARMDPTRILRASPPARLSTPTRFPLRTETACPQARGDCKNAFCQPRTLPDNELVIVTPPPGCPISPAGTYWKLLKTLYGLRRSP